MFRSADDAIRFAFRMRHKPIISMNSNVYISKGELGGSGHGKLSAYDLHAQSGMIWGCMERLPREQIAWIYAVYGEPREKRVAARVLSWYVGNDAEVRGLKRSNADLRRTIESRSIRHCAKLLGVTPYKAMRIRRAVTAAMEPLGFAVYEYMERRMGIECLTPESNTL